ncbi:MAG: YfhO family protein [Tannerella sp.]|nr:YfhO family protein [Tannerella sp.]
MQKVIKKAGKHVLAIALFLGLVMAYFAPAVFDGKVIQQGDNIKAYGMGGSQNEKYEKTAKPGELSLWSDAMFGGMPYVATYGHAAPQLPSYSFIDRLMKEPGYTNAAMVFTGLVCFYILMCVLGVNWWLALAGAFAFAFASYNIIIIEAGHIVKAYVIAYMPLTLAGMVLLYKRKYLWGSVTFLLGVAFSLLNGHVQITYYLVLLCLFIYLGYTLLKLIREKAYAEWGKVSLLMLACVVLAALPNAKTMYVNWESGQHSLRGPTELTPNPDAKGEIGQASTGLDKDYAFQWSYGWKELLTIMVPDVYGGASGGTLGADSHLVKALRQHGAQVGNEVQSYTYWGDKAFTSGPVYFGALVCFLFLLGMFFVRNPLKWWMLAGAIFLTFLALGRNFSSFNDLMFYHLPMYNKFRTVEMALVIPGLVCPIIAIWGLAELFRGKVDGERFRKGFSWSLGITGGLCLLLWLLPTILLSFQSPMDVQLLRQVPAWYVNALEADRQDLASSDALRSLVFILLGAALLWWYWKKGRTTAKGGIWVSAGIAILILVDLWSVDRRYINDSSYTNERPEQTYKESVADKIILQDPRLSFRVLGDLGNPWQSTEVSYYHHSIGGYSAVKMRRYQELIDHRLDGERMSIINCLQKGSKMEAIDSLLAASPTLNMLNTAYIIYNPGQAPLPNRHADGNCWFVKKVDIVPNADAEIAALNRIDPRETAVVDKRFAADLQGFTPPAETDSTADIQLTAYRPSHLTYKSRSKEEQLAVFSEIYYQPGWNARIDGKPAAHFRADWTLRAMRIPAGEHTITFDFRPKGYVQAAYVSSFSSLFILLLLVGAVGYSLWEWRKRR